MIWQLLACLPIGVERTPAPPFSAAIQRAAARVVKLYGAGLGREKGYGSGVVVSADGLIVTTTAVLLESSSVRVVLPDGQRVSASVVGRDESRQLALLRVEARDMPHFGLEPPSEARVGDWVLAASNVFKVADGPEPISVIPGVLSGRSTLDARRRAQDVRYAGEALLTDAIVSTPGSAGGALVNVRGDLIGVIGRPVVSNRTNTWLNYAVPVDEVAAFVREALAPATGDPSDDQANASSTNGSPDLGVRLFDLGGRLRPAFVERVRSNSPAAQAGLRPNDLILSVDDRKVATCAEFYEQMEALEPGRRFALIVKRGDEVVMLEVSPREGEAP